MNILEGVLLQFHWARGGIIPLLVPGNDEYEELIFHHSDHTCDCISLRAEVANPAPGSYEWTYYNQGGVSEQGSGGQTSGSS